MRVPAVLCLVLLGCQRAEPSPAAQVSAAQPERPPGPVVTVVGDPLPEGPIEYVQAPCDGFCTREPE